MSDYGTAEHAATEALTQSGDCFEGYVSGNVEGVAAVVVAGLRDRGFVVTRKQVCDCGWPGIGDHLHDKRLGRAEGAT